MTANPTCGPDTVTVSGCSDPFPRLLYTKVTNVSGCSQFDGKVVQILHDSASGLWKSNDPELVIDYSISSTMRTITAMCVGDFMPWSAADTGSGCTTPVDDSFSNANLQCCGTVDLHIGELP